MFLSSSAFSMSIYDFKVKGIDGSIIDLSTYSGRPMLVVNIATHCGYTYQLKGLEKLYQKYKSKKLVVLGIPSNDFGGQTPEGEKEVKSLCQKKYGVTFPLTEKTVVSGSKKSPLFKYLTGSEEIAWNFEKFVISPEGKVTKRFRSSMQPLDPKIRSEIEGYSE